MADMTKAGARVSVKSAIARDFGAASTTYNPAARLQRYMGQVMLDQLQGQGCLLDFGAGCRVLDLGCGTGWFTGQLADMFQTSGSVVVGADLSPGMLGFARSAGGTGVRWLAADAESLPLEDSSLDLVFSNLMIQWCSHSAAVLSECRRVLRPGGRLFVSTLLDGTLDELKRAWFRADPEHEHVNRFESEEAFRRQAVEVLPESHIVTESITLDYPSPLALLAELKAIGAGFKGDTRRRNATAPGRLRTMCRHYPKGNGGQVHATYKAAWLSGHLPH